MDAVAENGRDPVNEHQIQRNGTGRPNLSRETKFSGANGNRETYIFSFQLTTSSRIGNFTRLIHTLP